MSDDDNQDSAAFQAAKAEFKKASQAAATAPKEREDAVQVHPQPLIVSQVRITVANSPLHSLSAAGTIQGRESDTNGTVGGVSAAQRARLRWLLR